jgi:FKBP-type peptidyl-prolyl cis-trans isomerase FkpA
MIRVCRNRLTRFVALALVSGLMAACSDSPTSPSDVAFSVTDVRTGTGAIALPGRLLAVHYTGWLYDPNATDQKGGMFDTSRGDTPLAFTLGDGDVIAGWEQGVPGMTVGGLRRLVVPPDLAYGNRRNGAIPPYATLIFEIELVAVD